MKKILLIGAILMIGATSFSAVTVELVKDSMANKYSGNGDLPIKTRLKIIDATDKGVLVITPTSNAGPDGTSMLFDYGSVPIGGEQTLTGTFTAEVITKKSDKTLKADLSSSNISVSLYQGGQKRDNGIKFTVKGGDGGTQSIVDLSYQLTGNIVNNGKTYEGNLMGTASVPSSGYNAGSFMDKSVEVEIKITDITLPMATL